MNPAACAPFTLTVRFPEGPGIAAYLISPGARLELHHPAPETLTITPEAEHLVLSAPNGAKALLLEFMSAMAESTALESCDLGFILPHGTLPAHTLLALGEFPQPLPTQAIAVVAEASPLHEAPPTPLNEGFTPPTIETGPQLNLADLFGTPSLFNESHPATTSAAEIFSTITPAWSLAEPADTEATPYIYG